MSKSKIRWAPFKRAGIRIYKFAGYLNGESGVNYSYSIQVGHKNERQVFWLSGPRIQIPLDFLTLEAAKSYAEEREANK